MNSASLRTLAMHSSLSSMSSSASSRSGSMRTSQILAYKARNIAMQSRPQVDIVFNGPHGPHGDYVTSYSTMDKIQGTVNITATQDVRFDEIEISFVGIAKAFVDRLTSAPTISGGRTEATHRFLKLVQPIDENTLPHPRLFTAGKTYSFPFTFVVPERLLERSCTHKVANHAVREAHRQLPPSMGDADVAGFGGHLLDDMSPEMAKILYMVKVRAVQIRQSDDEEVVVVDKARKVRIKPAFDEQPPVNIEGKEEEYRLRATKTIRKGLFKGKTGTLVMHAQQPKSLRIPGARTAGAPPAITTMAKVLLRFDPSDENSQPPKLGSLTSKLKVSTIYSSSPRVNFPSKATLAYDLTQGYYSQQLSLSSRCVAGAGWTRHESENMARRDSGASLPGLDYSGLPGFPDASSNYHGKEFYTAAVLVPITLPTTKNFLPTFYSCLIARQYTLILSLSTAASLGTSLSLKVPIQISAEGSEAGVAAILEQQREIMEAADDDTDAIFQPRNMAPPEDEYPRRSSSITSRDLLGRQDLPPSYEVLAPMRRRAEMRVVG